MTQQSFIPTPETVKAKGLNYDELYPRVFSQPATYVRFSATVEESIGVAYCINDEDSAFLAKLNDGKDFEGRDRKDKLNQCSVENFEDVMTLFEEASARNQPFVAIDSPPILSLEEIEQSNEEHLSADARLWLKPIYAYWVVRKTGRARMPTIKVRVLDTSSEADDADPYICFRRREVRQTRKTRGRDAQVVDKLKKLRMELEQARKLVQLVVQRERLNKDGLETSRKLFEERRRLKEVKVTKNIIGEKGDDEELLVNQKVSSSWTSFDVPVLTLSSLSQNPSVSPMLLKYGHRLFESDQAGSERHQILTWTSFLIDSLKPKRMSTTISKPARNSTRNGTIIGSIELGRHSRHPQKKLNTHPDGGLCKAAPLAIPHHHPAFRQSPGKRLKLRTPTSK